MWASCVTFLAVLSQLQTVLAACSCGQAGQGPPPVISSTVFASLATSTPGKWCWQVALQSETGSVFCSAILVDRYFAVTPAQCIFGRKSESTFVRVGALDLSAAADNSSILAVEQLYVHEGYLNVETSNEFNIGMIKFSKPVECGSGGACLACLPAVSLNSGNDAASLPSSCLATTWNIRASSAAGGKLVPRPIQERPASIMGQFDCEMAIRKDGTIQSDYHLADSKFCLREATNASGCLGDLGDPLVCYNNNTNLYELTGMNTIGFSCFRPSLPSFYVRVASFVSWISNVTTKNQPLPPTFVIPNSAIQTTVLLPVVAPTTPAATAAPPSLSVVIVPVPAQPTVLNNSAPVNPPTNGQQFPFNNLNPMGFSTQRIAADGTLEQVGADGSVQRQQAFAAPTPLLQQVSPGVFRANIGSGFVQVGQPGSQFVFPSADATQSIQPVQPKPAGQRRKRDNNGVFGGSNSSLGSLNVPLFNVAASDVTYDASTGKLQFALPQGQTAFSSVSFVPSSVDSIKDQIIAQQDRILAQVDNFKRNILVSISGNFPQFSQSGSGLGGINSAKAAAASASSLSGAGGSSRSAPIPKVAVTSNVPESDDEEDDTSAPVSSVQASPVNLSNMPRPSGMISSVASAGGSQHADPSNNRGTLRTVVHSDSPGSGSFSTSLKTPNSQSAASAGFQGAKIHAETVHAPGSASSSVSASSGRK